MLGILAGSMSDPLFLLMLVAAVIVGLCAIPLWSIALGAFVCGLIRHYIALQNRHLLGLDLNNLGYHLLAITTIALVFVAVIMRLLKQRRKAREISPPY
jgi:hypothetical protein